MMNKGKKILSRYGDSMMLFIIMALVVAIMSMMHNRFFSINTFEAIAYQLPEMGLLTLSMMITMITGGINLSSIASANLSGIVMAMMMTSMIPAGNDNPLLVSLIIVVGIAVSVLVGLGNGIIIAYFKVPPILATLAMQMLVNGVCLVLTKGAIISGYPASFLYLGNGSVARIPVPLIIFILCVALMALVLLRTPLGMNVYLFGSNPIATEFSGVNPHRLLLKTYTLSGFFVGVAAVILTSRFNSATAGYAESYLLQSVLIAVLGGISPNGGTGRVSGAVLAVIILQTVASGLNLIRVSSYLSMALWGIILLLAVAIRSYKKGGTA